MPTSPDPAFLGPASSSRGPLVRLALLACALAPAAAAQDPVFLYTLREQGAVLINGTQLEKAPGAFNLDPQDPKGEQRWQDLAVVGSDRWVMRVDGLVHKNGVKLHKLAFTPASSAPFWFRMHLDDEQVVYAIRTDGMVVRNGQELGDLNGAGFADLTTGPGNDPDIFVLRVDGSVFSPDDPEDPGFKLDHDRDPDFPEVDGSTLVTQWLHLARDPFNGRLLALRADGIVYSVDPDDFDPDDLTPPNGTLEAELPFPPPGALLYSDLELRETLPDPGAEADWYALRIDGRVFSSTDAPPAPDGDWEFLVDLPGDGLTSSAWIDLAASPTGFWTLRFNGAIHKDLDLEPTLDVPGTSLTRLALSDLPPDTSTVKNRPPVAALYVTRVVAGQGAVIPVRVVDRDLPTDDLVITLDEFGDDLPGATFDPETQEVTFPGAAEKGSFRFVVRADDGELPNPRKFTFPVKVLPPDENPDKNLAPVPCPIRGLLAFVDQELVFPILATDRDGDALTITPVNLAGNDIFDAEFGATFDGIGNVVTWTPAFEHIGFHRAVFDITDDGVPARTKRFSVRIEVATQLAFELGEG